MAKEGKKLSRGAGCAIVLVVVAALALCLAVIGNTAAPGGRSSETPEPQQQDAAQAPDDAQGAEPQDQGGQVLYDGEGVKVEFGGLENVDAAGVSILSLVVENKTGQDVSCIAETGTLSVNGFNIDPVGGAEIQAGKSAVAQFTLSHKQANIEGTDGIEDIAMNLELVVLGSSVDVVAEAPISIAF